jgi:hypothetical protein
MGGQNVVPSGPQPSAQDLNNAYSDLLDDLNEAYWAAGTLEVKDQLYGAIEAVSDVISALDAADLQTRDARYASLVANVTNVNKQLGKLQQDINMMISRINTAAAIVSDVAKVVSVAAKVIPIL